MAAMVAVGGLYLQEVDLGAMFGSTPELTAAFSQDFLLEQNAQVRMANVAAFLVTAAAAAESAAKGDVSKECVLGSSSLPETQCIEVLQKFQQVIPGIWKATMNAFCCPDNYGTGAAAPLFIKVTVKQALGFDEGFTDPLTKM
eukprot:gnl/MRDRNA2_/MRDRNA2_157947_c0_seq1.p1 gnl/MRDRNA2_/MRDRNA2_157947_c0~~gnl/MRDRNA2_/MRDRNA2_157947_c0_seq1.p1  ORF type:complete len:143 (-),score=38.72 gnl/MRDRNA2_/MRDRNA2_157947_c0_seq1:525-953(-)